MNHAALYQASALAAVCGGLLRIFSALPLIHDAQTLEWFYTAIDVLLLFGLMGIYFARAAELGFLGFASFAIAVAALSFIGGPDADPFGFSTYEQGAATLAIAMVGLSIAWVRAGEKPLAAPICWFGSVVAAGLLNLMGLAHYGFAAAGLLFGLGFVLAGMAALRARP